MQLQDAQDQLLFCFRPDNNTYKTKSSNWKFQTDIFLMHPRKCKEKLIKNHIKMKLKKTGDVELSRIL